MITSSQNQWIKYLRSLLQQKDSRRQDQVLVAEGVRLVEEGVHSGRTPQLVLYSEALSSRGQQLLQKLQSGSVKIEEVSGQVLNSLSETETSQGILAVFPFQFSPLPASTETIVLLDNIRDPGNLGTILRTALAGGVQMVVLTEGCADVSAPKVVRSAMGAHFTLPIAQLDTPAILQWINSIKPTIKVWKTDVSSGKAYYDEDLTQPGILMIGNEAHGLSEQFQAIPHQVLHIPMPGSIESLNAAIASAILIFERARQLQKTT